MTDYSDPNIDHLVADSDEVRKAEAYADSVLKEIEAKDAKRHAKVETDLAWKKAQWEHEDRIENAKQLGIHSEDDKSIIL